MKRRPAQIEVPDEPAVPAKVVREIEASARQGELVPVEFTSAPMLFETRYVQNAIKWRVAEALMWFKERMDNGEANAKDMDVQLKYLEFANLLGANQAQDPMEKFNLLSRSITKTVTVTEKGTVNDG